MVYSGVALRRTNPELANRRGCVLPAPSPRLSVTTLQLFYAASDLRCEVERYESTAWGPDPVYVRWSAAECPNGYEAMADGVVFVMAPSDYRLERYSAELVELGAERYGWFDRSYGDRVLITVLPTGCTIRQCSPEPWAAKVHHGRVALLWTSAELDKTGSGDLVFTLDETTDDPTAVSREINRQRLAPRPEPIRLGERGW